MCVPLPSSSIPEAKTIVRLGLNPTERSVSRAVMMPTVPDLSMRPVISFKYYVRVGNSRIRTVARASTPNIGTILDRGTPLGLDDLAPQCMLTYLPENGPSFH